MSSDPFETTHWSLIFQARGPAPSGAMRALNALARQYWRPLHDYVRRRGYSPQDAEDLTQGFFARFIEKDYLANVSGDKGRFRAFLLAAIKHYLADEYDRGNAQKRGGGQQAVTVAAIDNAPCEVSDPESAYNKAWALAVLEDATHRLERRYTQEGKHALFKLLRPRLGGDDSFTYDAAAERLQMDAGAVRTAAHRLRHRYKRAIEEVVLETLSPGENLQDELRFLLSAL